MVGKGKICILHQNQEIQPFQLFVEALKQQGYQVDLRFFTPNQLSSSFVFKYDLFIIDQEILGGHLLNNLHPLMEILKHRNEAKIFALVEPAIFQNIQTEISSVPLANCVDGFLAKPLNTESFVASLEKLTTAPPTEGANTNTDVDRRLPFTY